MRAGWILVGLAVLVASAATAQDLSGPLIAPGETPAAPIAKPAKPTHAPKRAKAGTPAKRTAVPAAARLPATPERTVDTGKAAPAGDPVSFGMKWNGSNESVGQTRIDNLNGGAVGTGAEVGLKLHF